MRPNIHFMKEAIYRLKQNYGVPATFIQVIKEETNSLTGRRSVLRDVVQIARVVRIPGDALKKFWYDIAFIRANNNFTYGGEVQITGVQILVEAKDIGNRQITTKDFFVLDHVRYSVEKAQDLEFKTGWFVSLKAAEGMPVFTVLEQKVQSNLQVYGRPLMREHIPRWTYASIKDVLKTAWSGAPIYFEGEDDRNSAEPFYIEVRIDGPIIATMGTRCEAVGTVEINVLLTVKKDQSYTHTLQDKIGLVYKLLDRCFSIRRVGSENSVDDGSSVTVLQLESDQPIVASNFGQVDSTVQVQQASVEAHYRMQLEV